MMKQLWAVRSLLTNNHEWSNPATEKDKENEHVKKKR